MSPPTRSPSSKPRTASHPATRVAKQRHETLSVDEVVRFYPDQPDTIPPPNTLTHPTVLYLPQSTSSAQLRDMSFTAQHPREDDTAADSERCNPNLPEDCPLPDIVAKSRTSAHAWHGTPAFHEMNSDYFILLRNRRTKKTRLVQTAAVYRMRLRPSSQTYSAAKFGKDASSSEEEELDEGASGKDRLSYAERRKMLLSGFGGRKARIRMNKYARDRITEEKVDEQTAKNVTKAARDMTTRDKAEGIDHAAAQTTEPSAPPHDSDATSPYEAYPLLGLMSPGEFTAIEVEAKALLEGSEDGRLLFDNPGWRPLVWTILGDITAETDLSEGLRIQRIQAAIYLHYLLCLAAAPRGIHNKLRQQLMDDMAVSGDMLEALLERFTSPSQFNEAGSSRREKSSVDDTKIANYALLMWVTAKGFKNCMGLEELSVEVGVSAKLLASYAISMACRVQKLKDSKETQGYRVTLKVPLKFPQLRKKMNKPNARG